MGEEDGVVIFAFGSETNQQLAWGQLERIGIEAEQGDYGELEIDPEDYALNADLIEDAVALYGGYRTGW